MNTVSVVYITHRPDPRFGWFADALHRQLDDPAEVDVLLVDGLYSQERAEAFAQAVRGRFPFRAVPAKPSPYSGPHRLTTREYAATASARNTGIVHATSPYIVFADDLSVPAPGWWSSARAAARHGYVVAGAYAKHREVEVENGEIVRSVPSADGLDSRLQIQSAATLVPIGGGALYGCSFGAPKDLLLAVNGFDELCDSVMGEDTQLGYRIEHAGVPIYYDRRMFTVESEELHHQGEPPARIDDPMHPALFMARLREFGVRRRTLPGWTTTHMLLDLVHGTRTVESLGNSYRLALLTPETLDSVRETFPRHHWFDQRPLAEL